MTAFGSNIKTIPLVSCIMPTHDRRVFVAQAVQYFLRQAYPQRELVIVDNGTESIEDLVPEDQRIRYFRQAQKIMLGDKR